MRSAAHVVTSPPHPAPAPPGLFYARCYHVKARRLAGPGHDHQHNLAMSELYTPDLQHEDAAEWLASPYKRKTLAIVTEHFSKQLPVNAKLGRPCKHGHTWLNTLWCARTKTEKKCIDCLKARRAGCKKDKVKAKAYYERNRETLLAKRREYYRKNGGTSFLTEEQRKAKNEYKRKKGQELREMGLNTRGLPIVNIASAFPWKNAIKNAGKLPCVLDLIKAEQEAYWREHPEEKLAELKRCYAHRRRLRYLTQPLLRTYHKEKSKRRKTAIKGGHLLQVTPQQIRDRFACFNHACAYCGANDDLHIEHFIPISKGGSHVMGNILPACQPCNYNKRNHDPESWYRSRPFFSNQRWRHILSVLGKTRAVVQQLPLL